MKQLVRLTTLTLVLFGAWGQLSAATVFTTVPTWTADGFTSISAFGNPNTATYGQTFVAPVDNVLEDFTFYLSGLTPPDPLLEIRGMVFNWTGSLFGGVSGGAIGSALFTSPTIIFASSAGFVPVTVSIPGGLSLTAGNSYIALMTISEPTNYAGSSGASEFGFIFSHPSGDGDGGFRFLNNGGDYPALNSSDWRTYNGGDFNLGDLAWTANFSKSSSGGGVPEPASLAIWGLGFVACAVGFRRRKVAV